MKVITVLVNLAALDVTLARQGDTLHYRAPVGVMTEGLKHALRRHKAEIMQLIADPKQFRIAAAESIFDAEPVLLSKVQDKSVRCYACGTKHPAGWQGFEKDPCRVCHPRPTETDIIPCESN
jgi:hypothetical protein